MFDFDSDELVEAVSTEVENERQMEVTIQNLMEKTMWLEEQMKTIKNKQDETDLLMEATAAKVVGETVQSMMDESQQSNKQAEPIEKQQMSEAEMKGGFTSPEDFFDSERANQTVMK